MVRQVDVDIVRRVVGTMPGQFDALATNLQGAVVLKRFLRGGPCSVVIPQQELPRFLMADANNFIVEERGGAGMVGMMV